MQLERLLRGIIVGGIFALPFLPFVVSGSMFFPYITGKNFTFRIIVEIVMAAWVLLAAFRPAYRPSFSWLLAALCAFVLSIGISDALGPNPAKSFWSNFERMEGYVTLIHLLGLFVVASGVMKGEKLWQRFMATTVGASAVMVLFGLADLWRFTVTGVGASRIDGTFGNPIYLAIYAAFHAFFSVLLLVWMRPTGWLRYALVGNTVLQIFILYFTATRGTTIGLLGGAILTALIIALIGNVSGSIQKGAYGLIGLILLLVAGFAAVKDTDYVKNAPVLGRFATISLDTGTVASRLMIWSMAVEGLKERPVFGWGQENFSFVFDKYYDPQMYAQEPWFDRTHNIVFDWLIAGGLVGAVLYFGVAVIALYYLWVYRRNERLFSEWERALLTGLLAMYFFHNLFVFDNIISYILYILVLAFIHSRATKEQPAFASAAAVADTTAQTVLAPVALVGGLILLYLVNVPGMANANALIAGLTQGPVGSMERYHAYEGALKRGGLGEQEIVEQIFQAGTMVYRAGQVPDDAKLRYATLAKDAGEMEIARVPDSARIRLFYATFLGNSLQRDAALAQIEEAERISPKKQVIKFQKTELLLNGGKYAEAHQLMEDTYALAPEYEESVILLAFTAIYAGDAPRAKEVLLDHFGTEVVDDERILRAYTAHKMYPLVFAILEERIKKYPQEPQPRTSLAAAYYQSGDSAKSIKVLEEAIAAIPSYKEQGDAYIAQIKSGAMPK